MNNMTNNITSINITVEQETRVIEVMKFLDKIDALRKCDLNHTYFGVKQFAYKSNIDFQEICGMVIKSLDDIPQHILPKEKIYPVFTDERKPFFFFVSYYNKNNKIVSEFTNDFIEGGYNLPKDMLINKPFVVIFRTNGNLFIIEKPVTNRIYSKRFVEVFNELYTK